MGQLGGGKIAVLKFAFSCLIVKSFRTHFYIFTEEVKCSGSVGLLWGPSVHFLATMGKFLNLPMLEYQL